IPAFVAGGELADLADSDPRIVVLTADLAHANRTVDFAARHPDRFFNVGVAEQNMVSIAAGLASTGLVPFAATFAAYLALLACEQVRTDCAYTGMPVRLLAHHSGMSLGYYGTSHHALEDIAITRAIADLTVVCAADANELRAPPPFGRLAGRDVHQARTGPRPRGLQRGSRRLPDRQGRSPPGGRGSHDHRHRLRGTRLPRRRRPPGGGRHPGSCPRHAHG